PKQLVEKNGVNFNSLPTLPESPNLRQSTIGTIKHVAFTREVSAIGEQSKRSIVDKACGSEVRSCGSVGSCTEMGFNNDGAGQNQGFGTNGNYPEQAPEGSQIFCRDVCFGAVPIGL